MSFNDNDVTWELGMTCLWGVETAWTPLPDHNEYVLNHVANTPKSEWISIVRNDVLDTHETLLSRTIVVLESF